MLLDAINEKAEKVGSTVNVSKKKSMATSDSPLTLECKDEAIKQVNKLKYLDGWIDYIGETTDEMKRKI